MTNRIVALIVLVGVAASKGGAAKDASVKKDKKKPTAEKKEKKKEADEPVEEMDATEALLAEEPQSKDPFDELPKG